MKCGPSPENVRRQRRARLLSPVTIRVFGRSRGWAGANLGARIGTGKSALSMTDDQAMMANLAAAAWREDPRPLDQMWGDE